MTVVGSSVYVVEYFCLNMVIKFLAKGLLVLIIVCLIIVLCLIIVYYYFLVKPETDFEKEIQGISGIKVITEKKAPIPEYDGRRTIEIIGKGLVTFYYDGYGDFELLMLSDYNRLYSPAAIERKFLAI